MLLLDASQRVIDPGERGTGIGLFDGAFERQPNPGAPAYDTADPLLDEPDPARNFVACDSRRFHVRVYDDSPADARELRDGRRFVLARWVTRDAAGRVLDENDGASEIALVERAPGEFESAALMLVRWEADRDLLTHCGLPGRYPAARERRGRADADHRVRLASLDGDLVVSYAPGGAADQRVVAPTFARAERRRLPLSLFVGSRRGLDEPVASPSEVFDASLARAVRVYESIGIGVDTAAHPVAEALILAGDGRVRRVHGGRGGADFYYVVDARALLGRRHDLAAFDARAFAVFCERFPRHARTVRVLTVSAFADGTFGVAYPDCDFEGRAEAGACAVQADRYPDRAILAHEVGHVLTDKSHVYGTIADQTNGFRQLGGHFSRPAEPPDNRFIHFYNLMGGSRFRLYDVDVLEAPLNAPTRSFNQVRDIRSSPYVKADGGAPSHGAWARRTPAEP